MSREYNDWIRRHRLHHLCLQDLQKFKPGDMIDVAIFDCNMEEYGIWDEIPKDTPFNAEEFFRFNHHQIRINDNNNWTIIMFGEEFNHPIHYNIENLATNWEWSEPKKDETIRIKTEIIDSGENIPKGRKKFHVQVADLHPLTRIGWRGPIMLWKYVQESKEQVYWTEK